MNATNLEIRRKAMTRHIVVWLDDASNYNKPTWCVSLCREDGDEIKCLSTHDEESEAIEEGKRTAAELSLAAFARSERGVDSPL